MKIYPIVAEEWKIDAGSTFGVIPKTLWRRYVAADENNLIPTVSRCLLVETAEQLILFDTGMGNKQDEKFFRFKYRFGEATLNSSIAAAGFSTKDITDVVFTHLHYDHNGGAFQRNEAGEVYDVFPNATYWCSQTQWEWASNPNPREMAAYLAENLEPLRASGRVKFIEQEWKVPTIELRVLNGHTTGLLLPILHTPKGKVAYSADFIVSTLHIPLLFVAAFDINPLQSIEEKRLFLEEAVEDEIAIIFAHDPDVECCFVTKKQGKISCATKGDIADLISNKIGE